MRQDGTCRIPAIYLHSTWRTASTYVWAKFRDRPEHYCYFEPLNEHLADADVGFVERFAPWPYARHPVLAKPYLDEYLPLLAARGGIDGFPTEFTFGRYRLQRTAEAPALMRYFDRLEQFAIEVGHAPVFGCVRTDLRIGWFCQNRPGIHIALRRDPRRQFLSCLAQAANGNPYYLQRGVVILTSNPDDPAFAVVRELVDVRAIDAAMRQGRPDGADMPALSELYLISYALHRLASAEARHAHLVVDMDHISAEPEAARSAAAAIRDLTGTSLSFADCRIERYERQMSRAIPMFEALEAMVDAVLTERCLAA